ncbi:hypothetical protein C8F04DRAFT_1254618 [Mycena alexandri]|uniref:Thioesterase domain-containing protein n=1 Tax=Mycena alexandri TaxID=1745969 RepID=A0AAD6T5V1_9AGAR|nr:hypothetical protein C8F04DRAFT_1254618 [Mycena alexandri]
MQPVPVDGSLDILQAFEYDSKSASEGYEQITWSDPAVKMFNTTTQILRRRFTRSLHTLNIPDLIIQSAPSDLVFAFPTIMTLTVFTYGLSFCNIRFPHLDEYKNKGVPTPTIDFGDHTIVRLREAVSSSTRDLASYLLMATCKSGLWGIQVTDETPRTSFTAQTALYYHKIKVIGISTSSPYRIGGFSAGALLACRIAKLLEENGGEVIQLALIDNSFHSDVDHLRCYHDHNVRSSCEDALTWDEHWWNKLAALMWEQWNGRVRAEDIAFAFVLDLAAGDPKGCPEVRTALVQWMKDIQAPITVYKASVGPHSRTSPRVQEEWWAVGMDWSCKNVRAVEADAKHTSIVRSDQLVDDIQRFARMERDSPV